jgi:hypothetical protein
MQLLILQKWGPCLRSEFFKALLKKIPTGSFAEGPCLLPYGFFLPVLLRRGISPYFKKAFFYIFFLFYLFFYGLILTQKGKAPVRICSLHFLNIFFLFYLFFYGLILTPTG